MSALIINRTYSDPIEPTVEQLDDAYDSISTFFNVTGLAADNIEDDSLSETKIADNAVTESKLPLAVIETAKIQDSSVTLAKLAVEVQALVEPTGTVDAYAGDSAPAGWLICDGTAVSRTIYAPLFSLVGVRFGSGDGTSTFNVPDLSGRFIRGVDGTAGRDPQSSTRTAMNTGGAIGNNLGSLQEDDSKWSELRVQGNQTLDGSSPYIAGGLGFFGAPVWTGATVNSGLTDGLETRPKNAYMNFIIKT